MHVLRRYFFAGLLVWLPVWVTLLVLHFLVNLVDSTFSLLPNAYQPSRMLGVDVPGVGLVLSLVLVLLTGMLVTNILGKRLLAMGESILARIPIVRTIYMATKQVIETMLSSSNQSFRKVVLVEYPRKDMWSIAFLTGALLPEFHKKTGEELVSVFIPTTPNPTSGFLLAVAKEQAIELDLSVEQALKLIISLGVITSNGEKND